MISLQLTPLARARVWFHRAIPELVSACRIARDVEANPASILEAERVTLEAYVPRGARAEYGLLGIHFERGENNVIRIEVPYLVGEEGGVPWLDSLGAQVDDVRRGLSKQYATPVSDAMAEFCTDRFPAGTLRTVDGAHSAVGSSPEFFHRLARVALDLMLDDRQHDESAIATLLREVLIGGREVRPRPRRS